MSMPLSYAPPTGTAGKHSKNNWNTPRLLRAALIAICACALLLYLVVVLAVAQRRAAFKAVGEDSAPSILAAQRVRAYLADMDANAANELIALPGANQDAVRDFGKRRADVVEGLVSAAQNITYGQAERGPVLTLVNGLADYERDITQARDFHERGDPAMLAAYRNADTILHDTLLPAVDALDKVNTDALNAAYTRDTKGFTGTLLLTLLVGGLLLAALVVVQLFLNQRVRRTLNPGLLGATIIAVVYLFHTSIAFIAVGNRFKAAKEEAFDSVHALWRARAAAFDANADESRWLLDRPLAADYEKAFEAKSAQIALLPPGVGFGVVELAYTSAQQSATHNLPPSELSKFKGFLADELNNVTFEGEREAAVDTLHRWEEYVALDTEIRKLENAGQHDKAVALCTGNNPGQSNFAYTQFDDALDKTLNINQKEFDANLKEARAILSPFDALNFVALLLIVGAAFIGMMPRLREYAF